MKYWGGAKGGTPVARSGSEHDGGPQRQDPGAPRHRSAIRHATNLNIPPEAFGLAFRPVRAEALRSAAEATDLGGLFLGMSLFLAASALLLTGLLFAFGIERRAGETGALLALGFTPARVAALSFAEAALVGLAGAALGALAGRSHAAALLAGLRSSWKDAVAGLEIVPHAEPWSMAAGAGGAGRQKYLFVKG